MKKPLFSIARTFTLLFGSAVAVSAQQNPLLLNEIVVAPPGTDSVSGCEYVELQGAPGVPLADVTYLDIDGDVEQNPGTINYLHSLNGVAPGANGVIVIASSVVCRSFDPQSNIVIDLTFQSSFSNRNNGTNSFLLVGGFSGLERGQDADANDDGVLDLPSGGSVSIQDSLSVRDINNTADVVYGNVTLMRLAGIPPGEAINAASRCGNNATGNSGGAFFYGDLDSIPNTNFYTHKPSGRSANFPVGGQLTPGSANNNCFTLVNEIVIAAPGTDRASGCEYVELRGTPNASLNGLVYLDVDGDVEQNPGRINYVRRFTNETFGSNGLLVIVARALDGSLCRTFDQAATVVEDPAFRSVNSANNNGTNSFLLITGDAAGIVANSDVDVDNNGAFDNVSLSVVDGYAVRDANNAGDVAFAPVLPRPSGIPANEAVNAFSRCGDNISVSNIAAFFYGDLDSIPNTNFYTHKPSGRSANFPVGGQLTPGSPDTACAVN